MLPNFFLTLEIILWGKIYDRSKCLSLTQLNSPCQLPNQAFTGVFLYNNTSINVDNKDNKELVKDDVCGAQLYLKFYWSPS